MFPTLRVVSLAAAVMLAAPGTGVAESGGFLKVPQQVWTNINRFVFLAALDVNALGPQEYRRRSVLPSWSEVYAASKQWSDETFPALGQLAAEIARDDTGERLQAMVQAAEAVARGADRGPFDTAATAVENRVAALLGRTATIKGQIDRLNAASRAVRRDSQQLPAPDRALLEIEIKAERASEALGAATLAWAGLQSDVIELRRVVNAAQRVDPGWYTRIGVRRWADVVGDARGFLTDMPAQQRYLRGEDYYDNCGVKEGRSYALGMSGTVNDYLGNPGPGDQFVYLIRHSPMPLMSLWQFRRLGSGWWQMHNVRWGTAWALDGGRGSAELVAVKPMLTSGQFWRIMPAGENRCYLVNSFEGPGYALDAAPAQSRIAAPGGFGYRVTLQPTTRSGRQLWSFTPVN